MTDNSHAIDKRRPYTLSDAFEALGRRMFPEEWSGSELLQREAPPVRFLRERHSAASEAVERTELRRDAALLTFQRAKGSALPEARKALKQAERELERANFDLSWADEPGTSHAVARAAFERRLDVQAALLKALLEAGLMRDGVGLRAHDGFGASIPDGVWEVWGPALGFRVDIRFSVACVPRAVDARRRFPVRIDAAEFEHWLEREFPEAHEPTPKEQCAHWLHELTKKCPERAPKSKKALCHEARSTFGLQSDRAFFAIWDREAPSSWKGAGAPRKRKSPH